MVFLRSAFKFLPVFFRLISYEILAALTISHYNSEHEEWGLFYRKISSNWTVFPVWNDRILHFFNWQNQYTSEHWIAAIKRSIQKREIQINAHKCDAIYRRRRFNINNKRLSMCNMFESGRPTRNRDASILSFHTEAVILWSHIRYIFLSHSYCLL